MDIWDAPGGGFGDRFAMVSFLLQKSAEEKQTIYLSRWQDSDKKPDNKEILEQMISFLDIKDASLVIVDDLPTRHAYGAPWHGRMTPAHLRWIGRGSKTIATQFEGNSSGHMKNASNEERESLTAWSIREGFTLVPVGLPLTMFESAHVISTARFFLGVCSGMSLLAHSVGAPCVLLEYEMEVAWWHGKNDYKVCKGSAGFIDQFHRGLVP